MLRSIKLYNFNEKGLIDEPSKELLSKNSNRFYKAFEKTPFVLNFYLVQTKYRGEIQDVWCNRYGEVQKDIDKNIEKYPNDLHIILTNNITASINWVPMTPWILAHRCGHAFQMLGEKFFGCFATIDDYEYDCEIFNNIKEFSYLYDCIEPNILDDLPIDYYYLPGTETPVNKIIFGSPSITDTDSINLMFCALATTKCARDNNLTSHLEVAPEFLAQFLLTGEIRLNQTLPHKIHCKNYYLILRKKNYIEKIEDFEHDLNCGIRNLLERNRGKPLKF